MRSRALPLAVLLVLALLVPAAADAQTDQGSVSDSDRSPADCLDHVDGVDLQDVTVTQLQAAMDEGSLTSVDLVTAYLTRIEVYDETLNAVRELNPGALQTAMARDAERAASGARGPLHGIPVLLKDNVGTDDLPTTAGSIALEGSIPDRDATLTAALRDAGAIILGKANLSEFANWVDLSMPNGYSSLGGQVVAPYDFRQDPSGSSTGPGVSAAMAMATITIGSETSGSIISPSTAHSLVGFKPTRGMVSRSGIIPLAPSFDTAGPMGRSVTDAAAVMDAISAVDLTDPVTVQRPAGVGPGTFAQALSDTSLEGVRIGVRDGDLSSRSASGLLFNSALATMTDLGAQIVPVDGDLATATNVSLTSLPTIFNDFKMSLNAYLQTIAPPSGVSTLSEIIAFNDTRPAEVQYGQNLLEISDAQSGLAVDPLFLGSQTAAQQGSGGVLDTLFQAYDLDVLAGPNSANTGVTAAAGYPNLTVPMGYSGARPQGIAIAGLRWTDAQVLRVGHAFQQADDRRIPPTEFNALLTDGVC